MAKKKPANPPALPPKLKGVRLDLSEESHRALRLLAFNSKTNMSAYVKALVEAHIAENKGKVIKV